MTIRAVLRLGHLALRQRARGIQDEVFGTQKLQTLIDELLETKAARSGAGLAAPQIDEPWRVVVVVMGTNPRYPQAPPVPERVLLNPEITPLSDVTTAGWEGCRSVPGLRGAGGALAADPPDLARSERWLAPRRAGWLPCPCGATRM